MAFVAGLIDSAVGGGGLIQIPALFNALPEVNTATLFGTNKLASVVGTTSAAIHYGRRITIPWPIVGPAAAAAAIGAWLGARAVSLFPPVALRPLILALLVATWLIALFAVPISAASNSISCLVRDSVC